MRVHHVFTTLIVILGLVLFAPTSVLAHCDGLDGPVVKAAQRALESGNAAVVVIWVAATDEAEVRAAFDKTRAVRTLSPEAKELADRYFFETVVRLHRASEGEPFSGLKPAGRDLGPAIPAADNAIDEGAPDGLVKLLTATAQEGLLEKFHHVVAAKRFDPNDVAAGREYVHAYVEFMGYVERLYEAAMELPQNHPGDSEPARAVPR